VLAEIDAGSVIVAWTASFVGAVIGSVVAGTGIGFALVASVTGFVGTATAFVVVGTDTGSVTVGTGTDFGSFRTETVSFLGGTIVDNLRRTITGTVTGPDRRDLQPTEPSLFNR